MTLIPDTRRDLNMAPRICSVTLKCNENILNNTFVCLCVCDKKNLIQESDFQRFLSITDGFWSTLHRQQIAAKLQGNKISLPEFTFFY